METPVRDTPPETALPPPPDGKPGPRARKRRRWRWIAGALVSIALAIGLAVPWIASRDAAAPSPTSDEPPAPAESEAIPEPIELTAAATPFRVVLTWSAPSDPVDVTGYEIRRDGTIVGASTAPSTTFVDSEVIPGTEYSYEVRALGSDGGMSDGVSVSKSTPFPSLAKARVEGVFDVDSRITSKTGYGDYRAPAFGWTFTAKCGSGPCDVVLKDIHLKAFRATFDRTKATYRATFSGKFDIHCGGTPVNSTGTIVLRVSKAQVIDGEWRATKLVGTLTHQEAAQLGCRFSRANMTINAKLFG